MRALALAIMVGLLPGHSAQAGDCADVAIVLAIDASSSINADEYELQIAGYRDALSSDTVGNSFREAGTVEIAAVLWADNGYKPQVVPWHRIRSGDDLTSFADDLAETTRLVSGNTDMGTGLRKALDLLTQNGFCADRMLVDISGDGRASVVARRPGLVSLSVERQRAEDLGVVINGLAILNDDADLADYYRDNVATGLQSFVMTVRGFETFRDAIAQKLMREMLAGVPRPEPEARDLVGL